MSATSLSAGAIERVLDLAGIRLHLLRRRNGRENHASGATAEKTTEPTAKIITAIKAAASDQLKGQSR